MSLIYLEGPDASGKTSLLNEIADPEKDIIIHNGVYSSTHEAIMQYDNQLYYYEEIALDSNGQMNNMYLDRGFIAENIYGPVMRDTEISGSETIRLNQRMVDLDAILILCIPPLNVCIDFWNDRQDEEYIKDLDKYMEVWHNYNKLIPKMNYYKFDYTNDSDYKKISEFLENRL